MDFDSNRNGDAFLKYGLQSSAYDFAQSKQKDYLRRTWGQHLGILASGGTMGAASEHFFTNNDKWFRDDITDTARSGIGFASFAGEYILSGFIKKRFDGFKDDLNKMWILSGKWLEQTFLNFGNR